MDKTSEKLPKEQVGYPTARGINEYATAFGKSRSEFINWLKDKGKVLDIGSGGGVLHKEIENLKDREKTDSNIEIVPIDIIYGTKKGMEFARYATSMVFSKEKGAIKEELSQTKKLDKSFETHAVGGSFTELPFPDESFAGVLASYSFSAHAKSKEQLLKGFSELYRVLKKGGEALVSTAYSEATGEFWTNWSSVSYTLDDLHHLGITSVLAKTIPNEGTPREDQYLVISKS